MRNWKKKIQNIDSHYYSLIIAVLFFVAFPSRSEDMDGVKYLVSFKTNRSACMARVNGIPIFNNFTYKSGTIATGDNITSFIEDGSNKVEVLMGPIEAKKEDTLYKDSTCELAITRDTINSSENVTTLRLSVDDSGKIIASSSSNYDGSGNEGAITGTQLAEDSLLHLHRYARNIDFSGIQRWSWVDAGIVSPENIPAIQNHYREIWSAIRNRDIDTLKKMTTISSTEMGEAEKISPDVIFESYDLPKNVLDKDLTPIDFKLDGYKLSTYCNGRVFRLTKGYFQNSPLRLKNTSGDIVYAYRPYMSIINGKVVIVR